MESARELKSDIFELSSALMICGPFTEGLKPSLQEDSTVSFLFVAIALELVFV